MYERYCFFLFDPTHNGESYDDDSDTDTSYNRQSKKNMAMNDTDSSDDEEMTVKDYERMMKSIW